MCLLQGRPVPCRAQIWWIRAVPNISVPCPHDPVPCQISKTPAARQRRLPCSPLHCSMKVRMCNSIRTFCFYPPPVLGGEGETSKAVPSAVGSSMVAGTYSANRSIRNQHQQTFLDRRKRSRFFSGTICAPPQYSANRSIRNQHQKTFADRGKLSRFFSGTISASPCTLPKKTCRDSNKKCEIIPPSLGGWRAH